MTRDAPTPRDRRRYDEEAVLSVPPVISGERPTSPADEELEDTGVRSVHARSTQPPPMTPAAYRDAVELTLTAPPTELRIDAFDDESTPTNTLPPAGRRSESLARMTALQMLTRRSSRPALGRATPPPRSASYPPVDYRINLPPALVPRISIPAIADSHTSSPTSAAVSTERPTATGALAALADRSLVLQPALACERLSELTLDHRAGFLLSLMDGAATIEDVLDMSPLPEHEVLSVLAELVHSGIVLLIPGKRGKQTFA